eukprot:812215-Alexandrium_andersonii.AAC.1
MAWIAAAGAARIDGPRDGRCPGCKSPRACFRGPAAAETGLRESSVPLTFSHPAVLGGYDRWPMGGAGGYRPRLGVWTQSSQCMASSLSMNIDLFRLEWHGLPDGEGGRRAHARTAHHGAIVNSLGDDWNSHVYMCVSVIGLSAN